MKNPPKLLLKAFCRLPATLAALRVNISAAPPPSTALLQSVPRYFIQGPFFVSSHQHPAKLAALLWQQENLVLPLKRTRERNYEVQSLQEALKVVFQRHLQAHELFLCTHMWSFTLLPVTRLIHMYVSDAYLVIPVEKASGQKEAADII